MNQIIKRLAKLAIPSLCQIPYTHVCKAREMPAQYRF